MYLAKLTDILENIFKSVSYFEPYLLKLIDILEHIIQNTSIDLFLILSSKTYWAFGSYLLRELLLPSYYFWGAPYEMTKKTSVRGIDHGHRPFFK
jgi:hypothetical protein